MIGVVFPDWASAAAAIHELRDVHVPSSAISVIQSYARSPPIESEQDQPTARSGRTINARTEGLLTGGAIDVLDGAGALMIPGIAPIVVGGALASTFAASEAAFSGGTADTAEGGLRCALADRGMDVEEARKSEEHVRHGKVLVTVDTSGIPRATEPLGKLLEAFERRSAGGLEKPCRMRPSPDLNAA
jgi:hypothetical protein